MIYKEIIHEDGTRSLVAEPESGSMKFTILSDGETQDTQIEQEITEEQFIELTDSQAAPVVS